MPNSLSTNRIAHDFRRVPAPPNLAHCQAYVLNGECSIFVGIEPNRERGIIRQRWHVSIAHPTRYPTWDEIKAARYELVPHSVTMAMILPPPDEYVNTHKNCFHLHEIEGDERMDTRSVVAA